jgi:hypothetical protein
MKALFLATLIAAGGFKGKGFSLPDGAVKVDDDRYRLSQTWEEALKWYRGVYPPARYPRNTLHSQTTVRAIHIANPAGGEWDGANIYEAGRGEVRVYVLTGKDAAKPDAAKPDAAK